MPYPPRNDLIRMLRDTIVRLPRESPRVMAAMSATGFTGREILDAIEQYVKVCDQGLDPNDTLDVDTYLAAMNAHESLRCKRGDVVSSDPLSLAMEVAHRICDRNFGDAVDLQFELKRQIDNVAEAQHPVFAPQSVVRGKQAVINQAAEKVRLRSIVQKIVDPQTTGAWLFDE